MTYSALSLLLVVVALLIVLGSGRLLFKGRWFLGWLRGTFGFLLVTVSALLALAAFDFFSYKQLTKEEVVASISFTRIEPQHYQVSLVDAAGTESRYELKGDLWQLDARVIKWNETLAALGLKPGYRLDRLSGRYFSLEKEYNEQRTVYEIKNSKSIIDVWKWARSYNQLLPMMDATYGSATYLPMADGALFSVSMASSGLIARPLNERATTAVGGWE